MVHEHIVGATFDRSNMLQSKISREGSIGRDRQRLIDRPCFDSPWYTPILRLTMGRYPFNSSYYHSFSSLFFSFLFLVIFSFKLYFLCSFPEGGRCSLPSLWHHACSLYLWYDSDGCYDVMLACNACVRSPLLCTNAVSRVYRHASVPLHSVGNTCKLFFMFLENKKSM